MRHAILSEKIQQILPAAQIIVSDLPQVPEIQLFLLDAAFGEYRMSDEEIQTAMNNPYYWVFCWASGQVLARWILDNKQQFINKTVVDFGSGSGIAAIAAKLAGAKRVIACDLDPDAILASRANAELNQVKLEYLENFNDLNDQVDMIIVADVLYDKGNLIWLDKFIKAAKQTIIADSRIKNFSHPSYKKIACTNSFTLPDLDESQEFRQVTLYKSY